MSTLSRAVLISQLAIIHVIPGSVNMYALFVNDIWKDSRILGSSLYLKQWLIAFSENLDVGHLSVTVAHQNADALLREKDQGWAAVWQYLVSFNPLILICRFYIFAFACMSNIAAMQPTSLSAEIRCIEMTTVNASINHQVSFCRWR